MGGAHRDPENIALDIKNSIIKNLKNFENYSRDEIYDHRKAKFLQIGRDKGFLESSDLSKGNLSYKETDIRRFTYHLIKNKYIYGGLGLVVITALITFLS